MRAKPLAKSNESADYWSFNLKIKRKKMKMRLDQFRYLSANKLEFSWKLFEVDQASFLA